MKSENVPDDGEGWPSRFATDALGRADSSSSGDEAARATLPVSGDITSGEPGEKARRAAAARPGLTEEPKVVVSVRTTTDPLNRLPDSSKIPCKSATTEFTNPTRSSFVLLSIYFSVHVEGALLRARLVRGSADRAVVFPQSSWTHRPQATTRRPSERRVRGLDRAVSVIVAEAARRRWLRWRRGY